MGNFLTQAGSDFWEILRKKLPESFGMQWGVPSVPDMAKPVNIARAAINAYSNLPTASNEDISRGVQGRMAMAGFGPKPGDLTSSGGGSMARPEINPIARADAAPLPPVANRQVNPDVASPVTRKNPTREAINNISSDRSGVSTPSSMTITPSMGREALGVDQKRPERELLSLGGSAGAGDFPGYRPSSFTREAINNMNALEAKGDWRDLRNWHGELTAARNLVGSSMNADVGMTSGQQNFEISKGNLDIAKMKAPGEIAKTAAETARLGLDKQLPFSGEDVGYWDPVSRQKTVLTQGRMPNQEESSLLKTQSGLILKQYEKALDTLGSLTASKEEKEEASALVNSINAKMGGQGPRLNPGERIVSKNNKRVVVNKNNVIVRELD